MISSDSSELIALSRRAERFQREHELERQKSLRGGQSTSHSHSNLYSRIYSNSRSDVTSSLNSDAPEGSDRVRSATFIFVDYDAKSLVQTADWDKHAIIGTSQQLFKDYLRLTTVCPLVFTHPYL